MLGSHTVPCVVVLLLLLLLVPAQGLKVNVSNSVLGSVSSSLLSLTNGSRVMAVLPGKEALESVGMMGAAAQGLWCVRMRSCALLLRVADCHTCCPLCVLAGCCVTSPLSG